MDSIGRAGQNIPSMPLSSAPKTEKDFTQEMIKDSLADGKNYDTLSDMIPDYKNKLQGLRMASKEFQAAQEMALKTGDKELIKETTTGAVNEQVKIAREEAKTDNKKGALDDLRTAVDLATKGEQKELVESVWGIISEVGTSAPKPTPAPKPPVHSGGCGSSSVSSGRC